MKKWLAFILVIIMFTSSLGCADMSTKIPTLNKDEIVVGVSIVPQSTFVQSIAGDLVKVVTMIPPGQSPANYQPNPKQMQTLSDASLYFSIGVPAETSFMPKLKGFSKDIEIINLHDLVASQYPQIYYQHNENQDHDHEDEHEHGQADPHIWLSPKRVMVMVKEIEAALSKIDPDNQFVYKKNANAYLHRLKLLDGEITDLAEKSERKTFMVYHPVYSYFAQDYGFEMITIEQEGKEASIKDLQRIIDLGKQENIQAIFYQAEINNKQSQLIADEIGASTIMVYPLASDYIESMKKLIYIFQSIEDDGR